MEIRPILSALTRNLTGPLLVACQIALCLAILANALYIVNLRLSASARPSGVADEATFGHLSMSPVQRQTHNELLDMQRRGAEAIRGVPGVRAAALVSQIPLGRSGSSGSVSVDRRQTQQTANAGFYFATPEVIPTMGLRLVEGRALTEADMIEIDPNSQEDKDKAPKVAVVTRELARKMFPNDSSWTGKSFYLGMGDDAPELRIVGVVERLQTPWAHASERAEFSILLPMRMTVPYWRYAVRTEDSAKRDAVLVAAEEALRKAFTVPVSIDTRSMEHDRRERYRNERAMAWMLIAVCALLLLVTVSGIVGMTMLRVDQRRKQIGVRRALGARWRDIVRYFLTENFLITSGGIAIGLVLAVGLNQLLISHLELSRLPLAYLAAGALGLWALGLAAVYGPASRAASIPPTTATRSV